MVLRKIKKYIFTVLSVLFGFILFSCRNLGDALVNPNLVNQSEVIETYEDHFKFFWNGMNTNYVFWDIDPTDWDAAYRKYLPMVQEIGRQNISHEEKVKKLKPVYESMTKNLIDHHIQILFFGGEIIINPGYTEVESRSYYHEKYSIEQEMANLAKIREENKITESEYLDYSYVDSNNDKIFYSIGYINKNTDDSKKIVYFRFTKFNFLQNADEKVNEIIKFYNEILKDKNIKGIIFDVRGNNGGFCDDLNIILGPLLSKPLEFAKIRSKNGLGRYDYSVWKPYIIELTSSFAKQIGLTTKLEYEVPIVVLADVNSISSAEALSLAVSELPNGTVIGERTFGGTGALSYFEEFYDGSFGISNSYVYVYTCSYDIRKLDGTSLEGKGLTPDIEVLFNQKEFEKGNDIQLRKAVDFLNKK